MHVRIPQFNCPEIPPFGGMSERLVELSANDPSIYPVSWWFVAIVSERKYGGAPRWDRQLGQGEALAEISRHDPRGRGPFLVHEDVKAPGSDAWTRGCLDALVVYAPHAVKWKLWAPGELPRSSRNTTASAMPQLSVAVGLCVVGLGPVRARQICSAVVDASDASVVCYGGQ